MKGGGKKKDTIEVLLRVRRFLLKDTIEDTIEGAIPYKNIGVVFPTFGLPFFYRPH